MDINDEGFALNFNITDAVVGVVGHGYIGQAVDELFAPYCRRVIYDRAKPELQTLDEVVGSAQVIFVAVPTPMESDGSCHTGIVESVLQDVQNAAVRVGRDVRSFIVVLKSTVPPGFTARMSSQLSLRLVFSPEFLTEKNSVDDFRRASRVLLGGDLEDAKIVFKFFESVWADRLPDTYVDNPDGPVNIIRCDPTVAELTKYFTNCYLATCVTFANEMYRVCQALGQRCSYDTVKTLALLDQRISPSHLDVPGHDGSLGFGGSCFPKDVNSMVHVCRDLGTGERLFSTVVERNKEFRPAKDWEELKGRAVL